MDNTNPTKDIIRFFKNIDYAKIASSATLLLSKIKDQALHGTKESTRMMLELYYVMMSEKTSKFNKLVIGAALAYQLLPNDFLSKDDYGVLGYLDNATILYYAYKRMKKSITPEIVQKVENTMGGWKGAMENFTVMKPEDKRV